MWVWITIFLVAAGTGLIGFGETAPVMVFGLVGFLTGVTTMVLSMANYEEETE